MESIKPPHTFIKGDKSNRLFSLAPALHACFSSAFKGAIRTTSAVLLTLCFSCHTVRCQSRGHILRTTVSVPCGTTPVVL